MEATKLVRKIHPEIKILVVTMYDDEKFIAHMIELGADGYLLKNSEPDEIKKAIHAVVNNGYYFSDTISKDLLKSLLLNKLINPSFPETIELSEIEMDVLKMICEEKTADDISSKISLSPDSVKLIRQHLIDKIGVQNIAGLKMFALKKGIEL
jgi:DNA-binding NarL/FixJ family response regulator